MTTLAQIILTTVDNNGSAENRVLAKERNESVGLGTLGNTLSVGLDVTEVTNVADLILRSTVGLAKGVEVGASRSATVGVVTELVDVMSQETVVGASAEACSKVTTPETVESPLTTATIDNLSN